MTRLHVLATSFLAACGSGASEPNVAPAASEPAKRAALPVLRDGFEGEALASFWRPGDHGVGRYAPDAVQLTDEHARGGRRSARITLRQGEAQSGDVGQASERAELDSGRREILDVDAWCGWSFRLPENFPIVDKRLVLAQWRQSELEGSALVAQRFRNGRHYLMVRDWNEREGELREYELPPIVPGRWNDMVWRARFTRGKDGLIEVYMNGELVVSHAGTTAGPGGKDTFYHKVGLYRDGWHEPVTVHVDSYALGGSFEDVDPARFPE
jgi:hypothetical protein